MNQQKLAKLKAERAKQARLAQEKRHREGIETFGSLKTSIDGLYELINGQEPLDLDKLGGQIEQLATVVNIKDQVDEIKNAIKSIKPEVHMDSVDLSPVMQAIKTNKPKELDLSELQKAIIEIRQRVEEQPDSQDPSDYKPYRRVVKVGNRLIFDDQPTTAARAGGGGSSTSSSSGGLTDAELRATPVPVSGTLTANLGTLNGASTAANQLTEIDHLETLVSQTPDNSGTWNYVAGTAGTEMITGRVRAITAHTTAGGTVAINGGDSIPLPAGSSISIQPEATLINPTIVFATTDSYMVSYLL